MRQEGHGDDVRARGKEWYEQTIRAQVECEANIGKIVIIDVETGAYRIDEDALNPVHAALAMLEQKPNARLWGERIGYDAAYALGGADLQRTAK